MPFQLGIDHCARADQQKPNLQVSGRDERAIDDGAVIAAHGVDGDSHRKASSCQRRRPAPD
jgi:hypothetical protein